MFNHYWTRELRRLVCIRTWHTEYDQTSDQHFYYKPAPNNQNWADQMGTLHLSEEAVWLLPVWEITDTRTDKPRRGLWGVFFNCIERDQCNVVALNAFVNCGAGLTGRIMTPSLWSEYVLQCGATTFRSYFLLRLVRWNNRACNCLTCHYQILSMPVKLCSVSHTSIVLLIPEQTRAESRIPSKRTVKHLVSDVTHCLLQAIKQPYLWKRHHLTAFARCKPRKPRSRLCANQIRQMGCHIDSVAWKGPICFFFYITLNS